MGFINLIRIFLPLSSSRCQNIYHYIILSRLFRQKKAFFFFLWGSGLVTMANAMLMDAMSGPKLQLIR